MLCSHRLQLETREGDLMVAMMMMMNVDGDADECKPGAIGTEIR